MEKNFVLDTGSMAETAEICQKLADKMYEIQHTIDTAEVNLINGWLGEGSKEFQKKYAWIIQQLKDLKTGLQDLAEDIRVANDTYIQTDVEQAKMLDGKTTYNDLRSDAMDGTTFREGGSSAGGSSGGGFR